MEKHLHNRISRAQEYALKKHGHLFRTTIEGIKRPQMLHLQEVADLVWISGGTEDEIIAAWLHDAVEDTDTTLSDIELEFGKEVAALVDGLTDPEHFAPLPLSERKSLQAERLQTSNVKFLATDPSDSMTPEECAEYIRGAKLLADQCFGISPLLDKIFMQEYEKGALRYGLDK